MDALDLLKILKYTYINKSTFDHQVKYDLPVRHAIDFSNVLSLIKLDSRLKQFNGYVYRADKKRVSFVVDKDSIRKNGMPGTDSPIYSISPNVDSFNSVFMSQNNLPLTEFQKIKTYCFVEKEQEEKPDLVKDFKTILILAIIFIILLKVL